MFQNNALQYTQLNDVDNIDIQTVTVSNNVSVLQ